MDASRLGRIPAGNGNGGKRPYRPSNEGIREWDPKPRPGNAIMITERTGPSIRTAVGWLYPLEHYDRRLSLDPLTQYAELLLIMGSREPVDLESVRAIMEEAEEVVTPAEFVRLRGYADLILPDLVAQPEMAPPEPPAEPPAQTEELVGAESLEPRQAEPHESA